MTGLLLALVLSAQPACALQRDARGHIARSRSAIRDFRKTHPCPATGKASGACPGFVVDHLAPLCSGGLDSPLNMAWQELAESRRKDKVEVELCRLIAKECATS